MKVVTKEWFDTCRHQIYLWIYRWILLGSAASVAFSLLCASLGASLAEAKDLEGRFGLGYNSEFANAYASTITGLKVPGISVKYAFARDLALEGILGMATTTPSNSVVALKLFKNIFMENHLNFYFMGGVGLLNLNSQSGVQFIGGFGVEFFIPGVDSLGLSVETGASFDNGSGSYAIKTLGVSFLDAGIHFYF